MSDDADRDFVEWWQQRQDHRLAARQVRALERIAQSRKPTKREPDDASALTPFQRDTISKIPAEVGYLRRTTGHVTVAGLARRLEIDRGTLTRWIKEGRATIPKD